MAAYDLVQPFRRFIDLLKVDKSEIGSIYVYALFNGIVSLSLPLGIQAIINLISGGQVTTSWIVLVSLVILGVAGAGVLQVLQLSISENIQQKIFTRSAFEFAYRIPRMNLEATDQTYIPELVNRFFDTLSVQKGLSKILMDDSSASLQVIFGLVLLSFYHPFFILFSLILLFIIYLIFILTGPKGLKTSLNESEKKYQVVHWLDEIGRTMETFKLAGSSPLPMQKTDEYVVGYLTARKAHFRTLVIQFINLIGFKVLVAAGLLIIGGLLVINQQMNIGQFVASEIIIILVMNSVEKLVMSMETIYDVLTALEKIGYVTDIPLDRKTGTPMDLKQTAAIGIRAKDLTYRFKGDKLPVLTDINLAIEPGDKVCISGVNAAGKSILLQVLAGLYDEIEGSLNYNGEPFGRWCKQDLHTAMGDNLANEDIFQGTISENISLGKSGISIVDIRDASIIVGLDTYVESLSLGYGTVLLSEGNGLPKSVRLRIMLARCIVGSPKLVLLEDNFNRLVTSDKERFLQHLKSQPWTAIVISNELNVAKMFDRAVVLENGQIISDRPVSEMVDYPWFDNVFHN